MGSGTPSLGQQLGEANQTEIDRRRDTAGASDLDEFLATKGISKSEWTSDYSRSGLYNEFGKWRQDKANSANVAARDAYVKQASAIPGRAQTILVNPQR